MDKLAEPLVAKVATDTLDPLVLDFVEWVAGEQRSYADVLDAWKTSCPRLTVWEEASESGFVVRLHVPRQGVFIGVTPAGRGLPARARTSVAAVAADERFSRTAGGVITPVAPSCSPSLDAIRGAIVWPIGATRGCVGRS